MASLKWPHPIEEADEDFFSKQYDNDAYDYDFKVQVGTGTIRLLNCVFTALDLDYEHALGTLPEMWVPKWEKHWLEHGQPAVLAVKCDITGRTVSYEAARIFFRFFYSGSIDWPKDTAYNSAQEVLVLASFFQVPYLINAAEMALQPLVDTSNCCLMLAMADQYGAAQIRAYCLYYAGRARNIKDLQTLSAELQAEVHQASIQRAALLL